MYLTWLDSNSWLIEMGSCRILLDPWLVGDLVFARQEWLFKGIRPQPLTVPADLDLLLLSQGLEDHAHPPSLQILDRQIPVVASPNAAKVVQNLGFQNITTLDHGQSHRKGQLEIEALPGSPIGPMLVENAYLLRDLEAQTSLYYEPHGHHAPELQQKAPIDVVIAPVVSLAVPLLGAIIQGAESALPLAQRVQPQWFLPTANAGNIRYQGILASLLKTRGSAEDLQTQLQEHHLNTRVITPQPGERTTLDLQRHSPV
ncbi:MAG: MBL fold metallo-hydrolase [Synechococcaceae cyanobacterium SM2_3_1]|nr:MBL fold metallo-hydrolase [Synechococcaceae cyanobacterium SM2_3_1]